MPRVRRRITALLAVFALPLAWIVAVAGPAQGATATATYAKTSDWSTGFEGRWTIRNTGDQPLNGWTLEWDFPSGTAVTSAWDARVTNSGTHWTARDAGWNGTLAPGQTATFGFNGSGPGAPANCLLNGQPCDGSDGGDDGGDNGGTPPDDQINLGYFTEWGVYGRDYHVKDIVDSGAAENITHINYAFGNVTNGECQVGDSYAAYDRAYSAAESVSGVADTWDPGALRGNFNQLRQLKERYPHIQVLWSFGGWTWSGGFTEAMRDPQRFARSCYDLVNDPRWAGVFDGIDLDWEYPNACGLSCDSSGPRAFGDMMRAFRDVFGDQLVTAAITADASAGGKIAASDYAYGVQYADYLNVMTYDFFGAWAGTGPTAPHSPLTSYNGLPTQGFTSEAAIDALIAQGVPANKLLLGIGFYGRGWTGVSQSAPGGSATGPAPGTYEQGIEDYEVLAARCPATGTVAGTAYAHCGNQWWSYDTPATVTNKMAWARQRGLGGAFFWEFSGDSGDAALARAIATGLSG
ncbi:chitinase [Streptomyces sp. 8K308]|uniref:glycosyl hydrolase family 18 protein n=1 Tax=Streptomyces sp. 8K308 TaxID=2530388 RepID=UPI00104F1B95|nr:glycosyl hydrolase family 18 protein [Streptomyces sp. 8K308]TDC21762.1 chitinase [Streptomyces sp. 8K308]